MAKLSRVVGTTSQILEIFAQNSGSTTGAGLTGLAYNTSGLTCYYKRSNGTASVAVSLVTIVTLGTYTSGGFLVVDGTNMPGVYEFHPPNAALASGADSVVFYFQGAANLAPLLLEIELTATSNQDAIAGGMSALPQTACASNASLLTSGTSTAQLSVSAGKVILQATQTGVTIPTVTTVTNQLTAAAIATAVWTDTTSGDFTTNSSPGKILVTQLGDAFTSVSSSVFTTAALANGPGGGSAPTAAQVATAVWQDLLASGDFTVPGSVGAQAAANTANVNLSQTLNAARSLNAIADTSLTLNDAFHCAIGVEAGQWNFVGTTWTCQTPYTATTLRTFTLDSSSSPTKRQ